MTYSEVNTMVSSIGLDYTYYQWPEGGAPALPYILFYYPSRDDFIADGTHYCKITQLNIEFYSKEKDFEHEELIESILETNGLVYSKEEQYIDSEKMYEVLYVTSINITEEINNGSES